MKRKSLQIRRITVLALLAALFCGASLGCNRARTLSVSPVSNPAANGSTAPNITEAPDGKVVLSWLEPVQDGMALKFSIGDGHSWSEPKTIVKRANFPTHAEAPAWVLMLPSHTMVSVWAEDIPSGGKWPGNYLYSAVSPDHGQTWSKPVVVHGDRSVSEHGFASLVALDETHAQMIWLDARDDAASHKYRLMAAAISSSGSIGKEEMLDDDVCTCCPTSLARTRDGLLAAYRDHSSDEVRDIYSMRRQADRWQPAHPIHNDQWHINACPVNGPSVASRENHVVAAWFTAAQEQPTVRLASSEDGGNTFGAPITLDSPRGDEKPTGKVAVSLLDSGEAIVAWLRQRSDGAALVVARVSPKSDEVQPSVLATSSLSSLGYPHVRSLANGAMITWGGSVGGLKTALVGGGSE